MTLNTQLFNKISFKAACLTAIFAISSSMQVHAQNQDLDRIVAVVNSDVIMLTELRTATQQARSNLTEEVNQNTLIKQVLEKMIMDKIQVQKAKAIGIKIDDAAVDTAMQRIAKQNNLGLQQLRVEIIERGLNYNTFRESIRDRLFSDSLRRRQQGRNTVDENEVDDLIQAESFSLNKDIEYQLVDIVIPNNSASVNQFNANLQRAQNLRKRLLLNPNLNAAQITALGGTKKAATWKNAETLSPVFSRTLSLLGEGEISGVMRDATGFHILQLVKQRGGKRTEIMEAKVRHILISEKDPQARVKVTQLRNRILAGEKFSQLAIQHSADKGSGANGGVLPMSNTANYVPPFANAANTLAINTLSQPIKTQFGWHIMEVMERKQSDKTRESLKNRATNLVNSRNKDSELQNWLKGLRDEAFVEYRLNAN